MHHARGKSSPHAWGCFCAWPLRAVTLRVFPTRVGVFPAARSLPRKGQCLPHTRGGVSVRADAESARAESSPHAWGCFLLHLRRNLRLLVFPTRVGVFLPRLHGGRMTTGLPHTRGGVSDDAEIVGIAKVSSPHAWGCFHVVFHAERAWRVFPTRVGVFLDFRRHEGDLRRLPHTRGGVSVPKLSMPAIPASSPHAWGCFPPYAC